MQHVLLLAEHTDHLLRFSFIASIRAERRTAGNDQKKMLGPRYGAPQSVCFPEIAGGLGLFTVRFLSLQAGKGAREAAGPL